MKDNRLSGNPKRCILYYPTISIPTGKWLRQSLLYWDEVGSIVPQRYEDDTPLLAYSPDIQYLKTEGVFRPFRPDESLFRQGYDKPYEFEEEFKAILASPAFQRLIPPRQDRTLSSKIHRDKISENLFYFLNREGLAKQDENDYMWFQFESNTALLYMAVLAKHIADEDIDSTVPGTDLPVYENLVFQTMSESEGIACLATGFWNFLPVPREDVSLSTILEFKRKRRNELLNFRQLLDEFQESLKSCQDKSDARQVILTFSEKVEKGLADLNAALGDARIATIAGSLKTIIKLDSPALWVPVVAIAGKATSVADVPLPWTLAGIGILGAIEIFTYLVDKRNERRATLRSSPFAYLYAARQGAIVR